MPDTFQEGWKYYTKVVGAGISAGAGEQYCKNVQSSIDTFTQEMYSMVQEHGDLGVGQCKGFVAESWHANTFNINSELNGSAHKVFVEKSNELGSVDISSNFGKDYSSKYIQTAAKSADAQAKNYYESYAEYLKKPRKGESMSFDEYLQKHKIENNPEVLLKSIYSGQYRLIPKDQLDAAIEHLEKLIKIEEGKDGSNRAYVYANYVETLRKLTDRVSDGEGIESIPLDKESAEVIVKLCHEEKFKPKEFGIGVESLVTTDYILQQALKAGYTAAVMSLVMEIAPKVCDAIVFLIKHGEADLEQLKQIGYIAIKESALGFIRGYISCALTIACNTGKLGEKFVGMPGNVIAAITVLAMNTVKNAWDVATGKITVREMGVKTEDAAIISIAGLIGGSIGIVLLPQLAVLGYMIGSFVGSVIGGFMTAAKNTLIMALCASTGITLFGLVDQDYTLTEEMMQSLGLEVLSINTIEPSTLKANYHQVKLFKENHIEPSYFDVFILRRGVIGVRKIGYV